MNQKTNLSTSTLNAEGPVVHILPGVAVAVAYSDLPDLSSKTFINEGVLTILGEASKDHTAYLKVRYLRNMGRIQSGSPNFAIEATELENEGVLSASKTISIKAPGGLLRVSGTAGLIAAGDTIILAADQSIHVVGVRFDAPIIDMVTEKGKIDVFAEELTGAVNVTASLVQLGVHSGNLNIAKQCLDGDPVYFNASGDLNVGDTNVGSDDFIALASGNITLGAITAGKVVIGAGVGFSTSSTSSPISCSNCSGDYTISTVGPSGGNVTISGPLNASGDVSIQAYQTNINDNINITGDADFEVTVLYVACDTVTITGDVTCYASKFDTTGSINIQGDINVVTHANILLLSDGEVSTGNIFIDASAGTDPSNFGIDIKANRGGGNSPFVIGGAGNTNGVNGTIGANNNGGGGSEDFVYRGGLRVENGNSSSNGGITVTNATDIALTATNSKSCFLIFDAKDGTLSLPAGALSAAGAPGFVGGLIAIMANTIEAAAGAVITAASGDGADGLNHGVIISATAINHSGLSILADGDGSGAQGSYGQINIGPQGALSYSDTEDPMGLYWNETSGPSGNSTGSVSFNGSGDSDLTLSTNGDHTVIEIFGKPINFSGGDVTLSAVGAVDHSIFIQSYQNNTGAQGLTFSGSGPVILDASGQDGAGGTILVGVDLATINSPSLSLLADGAGATGDGGSVEIATFTTDMSTANTLVMTAKGSPTGTGAGGTAQYYANDTSNLPKTSFNIHCDAGKTGGNGGPLTYSTVNTVFQAGGGGSLTSNGPSAGTGNGGAVEFFPAAANDFSMGSGTGEFLATANGGSSSGDAGSVIVDAYDSTITFSSDGGIQATVPGTNGKGGHVELYGATIDATAGGVAVNVDGNGTGDGGSMLIEGSTMSFGESQEDAVLTASANGSGAGGSIEIQFPSLTIAGALYASAGPNGNANGGTINLHNLGSFDISGKLEAAGNGAGTGGAITVAGFGNNLADSVINADGGDTGDGGSININCYVFGEFPIGSMSASTTQETGGGSIQIINGANGDLSVIASGMVQTTTNSDPENQSGSFTLIVSDTNSNNASVEIGEDGGFNSIMTVEAASVSFTAIPDVVVGLSDVVSNAGDIVVCADGSGSCAVAVAAVKQEAVPSNSVLNIVNAVTAAQNKTASIKTINVKFAVKAASNVSWTTSTLTLNANVTSQSGNVSIQGLESPSSTFDLIIQGTGAAITSNGGTAIGTNYGLVISAGPFASPTTNGNLTINAPLTLTSTSYGILLKAGLQNSTLSISKPMLADAETLMEIDAATVDISANITATNVPVATISAPTLVNTGILTSVNWGLIRENQGISGIGSIIASEKVILAGSQDASHAIIPAGSITITGQTITGISVTLAATSLTLGDTVNVNGTEEVQIFTSSGTNDGSISTSSSTNSGFVQLNDAQTFLGHNQLTGVGTITSDLFNLATSITTNIIQSSITGEVNSSPVSSLSGDISVVLQNGNLLVGEVTTSGSLNFQASGNLLAITNTNPLKSGANLTLQAGAGKTLTIATSSQISAGNSNGASIVAVTGAIPSSFAAGTKPASVTLTGAAVLGSTVFFGSSPVIAGLSDTVNTAGTATVKFNGSGIKLGNDVLIQGT